MWRWILGCWLLASSVSAQDGAIEANAVESTPSTEASSHESPSDTVGAETSDTTAASPLRQRFVFLRPGWMPHVTVGYRAHTIRFGGEREKESSRGITSGAVFPIVASGGDASRVRFALAAGLGIDFGHYRHRELDPIMFGEPTLTRGYVQRTRYFYGQVGGLVRVSFGRNALVTSLLWVPGRRTRSTKPYEDYAEPFPDDADDAMLARGRFSLALVRSHFHAGFFVGLGHASLPDERGVEIEYALQIGTGW